VDGPRTWWIGVLFAIGSVCFAVGALPGYLSIVDAEVDGVTFFVGSIFFTTAAFLQLIDAVLVGASSDRWASGIQFVGTLFFNRTTYLALSTSLDEGSYDHLVWAPDIYGCICFLVASQIAYIAVRGRRSNEWRIAVLNLAGSVAFAASGIASYVAPGTDTVRNMSIVNIGTCVGALCFLAGAILLLPRRRIAASVR
jgi:hypothetical protein